MDLNEHEYSEKDYRGWCSEHKVYYCREPHVGDAVQIRPCPSPTRIRYYGSQRNETLFWRTVAA